MKKDTPVQQLLKLVWTNANSSTGHSWERLNNALRSTVSLAISSGMEWTENDYALIFEGKYRPSYWLDTEHMYRRACMEANTSAVASIEAYLNRPPFICDDVRYPRWPNTFAHIASGVKRGRVFIGASFSWKGDQVTVTSFADDQLSFTACSYKPNEDGIGQSRKVKKRYTITRDDIIQDRKARKLAIKKAK